MSKINFFTLKKLFARMFMMLFALALEHKRNIAEVKEDVQAWWK